MLKVYHKKGAKNYKEKKLERELQEFFESNPEKAESFSPATTPEELETAHKSYLADDAEIVSETKTDHQNFRDSLEPELFPKDDPMNRDQPIIRDYVLDDGFTDSKKEPVQQSRYDEPKTSEESFDIPDDSIRSESKSGSGPSISQPKFKQQEKAPDPDAKIKRKSKKKFTKYLVDAVCALAERGIVWYSTKDITQDKLSEYVEKDEISEEALNLLVMLDANTQGTVKQFFANRCETAAEFAKFTLDEKEDLAEALEDFLEFKKVEINPAIQLGVVFAGMLFERALKAITLRAETNSILVQLKDMHKNTSDYDPADVTNTVPESNPDPAGKHDIPQGEPNNDTE